MSLIEEEAGARMSILIILNIIVRIPIRNVLLIIARNSRLLCSVEKNGKRKGEMRKIDVLKRTIDMREISILSWRILRSRMTRTFSPISLLINTVLLIAAVL